MFVKDLIYFINSYNKYIVDKYIYMYNKKGTKINTIKGPLKKRDGIYEQYDIICPKCTSIVNHAEEGYICFNCCSCFEFCYWCPSLNPMKLIKWETSIDNDTDNENYKIENEMKVYEPPYMLNKDGFIDDSTRFYYECIDCHRVSVSECD